MDALRAQGPVARIQFHGIPAYLVTSHAALLRSFKDTENLPPERAYQIGIMPLIGENFQSMSGERHRLYRKLATEGITLSAEDFRSIKAACYRIALD